MSLNIGTIKLPLNAATKTMAILAKRGAGKTYVAAVLFEEFHKNGIPCVVFDPIDVWWGVRLGVNGKDRGLPIVVFGLANSDIEIDRDMGRKIAQAVVKDNISCIISTFGMPKVAQRHLISEFSEEILNINNRPRHIFIEEAHEFLPQRVFGGLGKVFNSVSNLVIMGRNKGLGVTLINQRAATINKDVLTQVDTLIALRNVAPQDRKALKEWVEYHAAEGDFNKFMESLPSLPTGEAWVWSPEFLRKFEKIKIRKRETFHPDRERLGEDFVIPCLDRVDINDFIEKFNKQKLSNKKNPTAGSEKGVSGDIVLRNECESLKIQLSQKDVEIAHLNDAMNNIRRIVGAESVKVQSDLPGHGIGNIEMWAQKLGNGGAGRIFRFLAKNAGMKFTRAQIGLAVGLRSSSGSFSTYISTIKRNDLIKEKDKICWINPDL